MSDSKTPILIQDVIAPTRSVQKQTHVIKRVLTTIKLPAIARPASHKLFHEKSRNKRDNELYNIAHRFKELKPKTRKSL